MLALPGPNGRDLALCCWHERVLFPHPILDAMLTKGVFEVNHIPTRCEPLREIWIRNHPHTCAASFRSFRAREASRLLTWQWREIAAQERIADSTRIVWRRR